MDLTNPELWKQQWAAITTAPYIMLPVIVAAFCAGVWFRKGTVDGLRERIAVLEERLRLARDQAEIFRQAKEDAEREFQTYKAAVAAKAVGPELTAETAKLDIAFAKMEVANNALSSILSNGAFGQDGVKMTISKVQFDPNGPTEFYIDFGLRNLGSPTTIGGWELTVRRGGTTLWERQPPRVTFSMTYDIATGRTNAPDDISRRPLASGERLTPHFTWTFAGNAKETFDHPGTVFHLRAADIRGRDIVAEYVIS